VLPFQADSAQETMIKAAHDDPMPLEGARPDIVFPPKLQTVLDKALARMPSDRYASAADFGRDAEEAVAGLPVPATRVAEQVTTAKTQLMDTEMALKAAKAKAPPATAVAPAPTGKKFPLVPVLGGVGGVGVIARRGGAGAGRREEIALERGAGRLGEDRSARAEQHADGGERDPTGTQQPPRTTQPGPGSRRWRHRDRGRRRGPQTAAPNPGAVANVADSLRVGTRFVDGGRSRFGSSPLNVRIQQLRREAGRRRARPRNNIASTYGDDRDNVIKWLRRSNDFGFSGAAEALRNLGVSP